jgi:hypothetical protein
MLHKVIQSTGHLSVYDTDAPWTKAEDIKRYSKLVATRFVNDHGNGTVVPRWQDNRYDGTWPDSSEADVEIYRALPITE